MIRRLSDRRRYRVAVAAGLVSLGLGAGGAVGLVTLGSTSRTASSASPQVHLGASGFDPCIVAIAYGQLGVCIQPPTT
jgi:hypothetical protein